MADRGPPDSSSGSNSDPGKPADRSGAGIEAIVDHSGPIIVNLDSINPIQKEPISAHNFYNRHKKRFWTIGAILACIAIIASLAATRNVSTRSMPDVAGSSTSTPTPTATSTNLSQESSPRVGSALAFSSRVDAKNNFDGQLIYQSKTGELWTKYYNESSGGFDGYNYPLSAEIKPKKSGTPLSSIFWDDNGKNQRSIFYIAEDGVVEDAVYDGEKWHQGNLSTLQLKPNPLSKLASIIWVLDGNPSIWLYFQDDKGYLQEAGMVAGTWQTSSSFPVGKMKISPGTGIVTSLGTKDGAPTLSIYTYLDDKLISYDYISGSGAGKGWLDGYGTLLSFIATDAVPNLTAISTANDTKTIYLTGQREFIWAVNWRNETGWQKKTTDIQSSGSGGLVVTRLPGDEDDHVFYTPSDGGISELNFNWVTGKATVSNFDIS